MTRVIITDPTDADSAEIIKDLTGKAGVLVADRYERILTRFTGALERFPGSGFPRPKLGRSFELASFCRMSCFIATFPTTISPPSFVFVSRMAARFAVES